MIQGFDLETQGLVNLVKFYGRLENAEEKFHTHGEVNHENNKTSSLVNATNTPSQHIAKVRTRLRNLQKRILTQNQK